jgi:hypothetical protein
MGGRKQETTNRIATRFPIDTERMGYFNEQSDRKTGSSKVAVIQISQFCQPQLYTSAMLQYSNYL